MTATVLSLTQEQLAARNNNQRTFISTIKCKKHPKSKRLTKDGSCVSCTMAIYRKFNINFEIS